jgi:C4-dicarboxylate-specific signal transduction histidine kinase
MLNLRELEGGRFDYLPALLETTPAVMALLAGPASPVLRDQANHTLLRINAIAGADMLFVLDEATPWPPPTGTSPAPPPWATTTPTGPT